MLFGEPILFSSIVVRFGSNKYALIHVTYAQVIFRKHNHNLRWVLKQNSLVSLSMTHSLSFLSLFFIKGREKREVMGHGHYVIVFNDSPLHLLYDNVIVLSLCSLPPKKIRKINGL